PPHAPQHTPPPAHAALPSTIIVATRPVARSSAATYAPRSTHTPASVRQGADPCIATNAAPRMTARAARLTASHENDGPADPITTDRKITRLNSSHSQSSYAV